MEHHLLHDLGNLAGKFHNGYIKELCGGTMPTATMKNIPADVPLVTVDKQVFEQFPDVAVSLDNVISSFD